MTKHAIGLIINPMAGRDIRRLVAYASLQSSPEKALAARRILAGIAEVPDIEVLLPEDEHGFFAWIQSEVGGQVPIRLVPAPTGSDESTVLWVNMLVDAGAQALVVVGGDGTQRNVAQAHPRVPVLPIAGGTNNVACYLGDQTAGGYAAARYLALGLDPAEVGSRAKLCHVALPNGHEELALIDVALTRQNYTGAMAVWDPDDVQALVLAVADAVRPGLSNVGGYDTPVAPADDFGVFLKMGDEGRTTSAVLAPGLMVPFAISEARVVAFDQPVSMSAGPGGATLALDGERTVVLRPGETTEVRIRRDGPLVLDPGLILAHAVRE